MNFANKVAGIIAGALVVIAMVSTVAGNLGFVAVPAFIGTIVTGLYAVEDMLNGSTPVDAASVTGLVKDVEALKKAAIPAVAEVKAVVETQKIA